MKRRRYSEYSRRTRLHTVRRMRALLACTLAGILLGGAFFTVSLAPAAFAADGMETEGPVLTEGGDLAEGDPGPGEPPGTGPEETEDEAAAEGGASETSGTEGARETAGRNETVGEDGGQPAQPSTDPEDRESEQGEGPSASSPSAASTAPSSTEADDGTAGPVSTVQPQPSQIPMAVQAMDAEMTVPFAVRDLIGAITIDPAATLLSASGALLQENALVGGGDALTLRYQFSFDGTQGAAIVQDDPQGYTIPLPAGLRWYTADGGVLGPIAVNAAIGGVEYQYANLFVDGTANRAYMVFTGNFWTEGFQELKNGWIELECRLDLAAIGSSETVAIGLFDGSTLMNLRVKENQPTNHALQKSGAYANNMFTWDITYTPGNVDGVTIPGVVKDTFDADAMAYVPGSFQVGADPSGLSPVPDAALTISTDGGTTAIAYDLNDSLSLTAGTPVYVRYKTVLADAQLRPETNGTSSKDTNAANAVRLYDADGNDKNISAADSVKVAANQKKWLSKETTGMSADGRHIYWKVTIKTLDRKLDHLVLYERLCDNHTLDASSVAVSGTTGSLDVTPGTAPKGGGYTFRITLDQLDGSYPDEITVTYTTDVKPEHFDDQVADLICNNWAWLDFDWYDYGDGTTELPFVFPELNIGKGVHTGLLAKTVEGYDRRDHTVTWKVTVNPHAAWVKNGVITDDLASLGLTYVDGSFTSSNGVLLELDAAASTPKKLVANLIGEDALGQDSVSFTFRTTVDDKADYAYNTPNGKNYRNTAAFNGQVRENREFSGTVRDADSTATATVKVTSEVLKKSGKYDYRDKTVTWTVTLNQNNMPMDDVVLKDTIPPYQSYVDGSARLNGGTTGFTADCVGGVLEIGLQAVNAQQTIVYKTAVDPDKLDAFRTADSVTLRNDLVLKRGGEFDDLPFSASVTVKNQLMKKSAPAHGSNDFIEYTVDLNPHGITLDGIAFKDTLPEGMALDLGSVRLYAANVNENGVFSAGSTYLDTDDLNVSLDPAQNSFSFQLPSGNGTYRLKYGCDIVDRSKAPFQNDAALSGGNVSGSPSQSGASADAGGDGGGGTGLDTRKAELTIVKTEGVRPGVDMSGIRFGLFQTIGGKEQCVLEETTDADGRLTFYPLVLNQTYTVKELNAPEGYTPFVTTASGNIALEGYTVTPTKPKSMGTVELAVVNMPVMSDVSFVNVNDWGRPLSGCDFELEDLTPGSTLKKTCTSDPNGTVRFADLPMGRHRLVQTTTDIPGHTANILPYIVEVAADGTCRIYPETGGRPLSGMLVNEVNKVDVAVNVYVEDGKQPLPGVRFEALDSDGKVVAQGDSDKNGTVVFHNLAVGETYTVVEAENKNYEPSPSRTFSIPIDATMENDKPAVTIDWPKTEEQLIRPEQPDTPPDKPDANPNQPETPPENNGTEGAGTDKPEKTATQESAGLRGKVPKTGDETNLAFWIALAMLSGGAAAVAAMTGKRRSRSE